MRAALIVCVVVVCVSACGGNTVAPSEVSTTMNVAGTWNGTIGSSNNPTQQVKLVLTQSGSAVTGSWDSSSVSWVGQVSGAVSGSSFNGQFTFSGTAAGGAVCTGTANVIGSVTASTMTLTSASGVVGGTCPAPLPIALKIDAQRQ